MFILDSVAEEAKCRENKKEAHIILKGHKKRTVEERKKERKKERTFRSRMTNLDSGKIGAQSLSSSSKSS